MKKITTGGRYRRIDRRNLGPLQRPEQDVVERRRDVMLPLVRSGRVFTWFRRHSPWSVRFHTSNQRWA